MASNVNYLAPGMSNLKTQIRATLTLGVLSLAAGLATHLSLTDIYHGEADVGLEWNVVRVSAVVMVAFIALAMATLRRTLKALP
jgi:hypothetical protein